MIWGVKGLWARPGNNNATKMLQKLQELGVESKEFNYLSFTVLNTYLLERVFKTEVSLLKHLKDGDSIIAHSFGGALVVRLLTHLDRFKSNIKLKNIYLFNPSIDGDIRIPSTHFENMYIFCNEDDKMLKMARLIPFNILGDLGREGYQYEDDKITNIEIDTSKTDTFWGHSDAMVEPNLTKCAKFIKMKEYERI